MVRKQKKALIISVTDYSDNLNLKQLDYVKNDGQEMYNTLKSLQYEVNDNLIGNVKFLTMRSAIIHFFTNKSIETDDLLLFYFSGHGVPDGKGKTYLASSEIDCTNPYENGFSFDDLTEMISSSKSGNIVLILDCCYSGTLSLDVVRLDASKKSSQIGVARKASESILKTIEEKKEKGLLNQGMCLLASSRAFQESLTIGKLKHSQFTYYLLKGLKGTRDSVNPSGQITAYTIGQYIQKQIHNSSEPGLPAQDPIIKLASLGEIILATNAKFRRPGSEPQGAPGHGKAPYSNDYLFESMHIMSAMNEVKRISTAKIAVITPGRVEQEHDALEGVKIRQYRASNKDNSWGWYATSLCALLASPKIENHDFIGVAPNSKLLAYEYGKMEEDSDYSDLISAISEAATRKPQLMLIALGISQSPPKELEQKINDAVASGITVISPAGNKDSPSPVYPAAYESVISVAAIKSDNRKESFSSFGDSVNICAHGTNIWLPAEKYKWSSMNGTIFSACFVAGAIALMYTANPKMTPQEVRQILYASAEKIDHENRKYVGLLGAGRLNVYTALLMTKEKKRKKKEI